MQWKNEADVDDYVKEAFKNLGLKKNKDFFEKSGSQYLKNALEGFSKTKDKSGKGIPDFVIESYQIPILIESKLGLKKLESRKENELKFDDNAISSCAFNGALHYAMGVIKNNKYKEAIAIGIAGDNKENVSFKVAYVFGASSLAFKEIESKNLDFLENKKSFESFYKEAILSEEDKHNILVRGQIRLEYHSKKLNKLMHNHNITAPQRVLYVSGMLLAMQSIGENKGLEIDDLKGKPKTSNDRDGLIILRQIEDFLKTKVKDGRKLSLMLESFKEISKDSDRDEPQKENHKEVSKFLKTQASTTKQIFAYLYEYIYSDIDGLKGHLDIMGQMYSEFLKYALGDGKELGIVLTPPYVTKMMSQILKINQDSKVMDLATGSAGFLISAMELMIEDAEKMLGKDTSKTKAKITHIKKNQLLGVELNAEMFVLATTNMILRGDGSSRIEKANTFDTPPSLYSDFNADRILLNPPFTHSENGMPFIKFGLDNMQKGGLGAIIIQDSAGSGKAITSNTEILSKHTLKASIKMNPLLFQPMAGVQTSIYVFEAGIPHDFNQVVKFIDFRNDGYKPTKKGLKNIDNAELRYHDIIEIYKNGLKAKLKAKWNLDEIYVEDYIDKSGADWNFDQHKVIDTKPTLADFKKCVSEYLAWEVSNVLKNGFNPSHSEPSPYHSESSSCHSERSEESHKSKKDILASPQYDNSTGNSPNFA